MEVRDLLLIASFVGLVVFIYYLTNTIISADNHYKYCQGRHIDVIEQSQNMTETLQPASYPLKDVIKNVQQFEKDCVP